MRILFMLLGVLAAPLGAASGEDWHPAGVFRGVTVEASDGRFGFDAHRASVTVCTSLPEVSEFIADVDNFDRWVAFTEEARLLHRDDERTLYYHKSGAPWPLRDRDMIYELVPRLDADGILHVAMTGVPDYLPPERGVVRMAAVVGEWLFVPAPGEVRVRLTVDADVGAVAKFLANRRLAATVGYTLANLADRFPCPPQATG